MPLNYLVAKAELNPKKLFLIDGIGAIMSALLLGVVLANLERIFGIPSSTLYFLAILPIFFAIYDFYGYRKGNDKLSPYLTGIAVINLLYCCLSIGVAFRHIGTITNFGWTYILIEILIVTILVIVELKVAKRLANHNNPAHNPMAGVDH
ncbi:MAG: hypothetical protein RIC35_11965 [Marinoscillum sp.]